jgi:hypothetical protein
LESVTNLFLTSGGSLLLRCAEKDIMNRDSLHSLIDRIPEAEVPAAKRFL